MRSAYEGKCSSLYRGIVEDNIDPEGLGRCKIRVPSIHGELDYPVSILPWARPLVLTPVGKGRGSVHLPDKGDIVWVIFEGEDRNYPIYFGGTYSKGDIPVTNPEIVFYEEDDTKIYYNRETRICEVLIGDNYFTVTPDFIKSLVSDKSITISRQGITIIGDTTIVGNLHVTEEITADIDVFGAGTSLHTHTHGGVTRGLNSTNPPD